MNGVETESDSVPVESLNRISLDIGEETMPAATSARGFGFQTGGEAEFIIEGDSIQPRLDSNTVTDIAFGSDPYVLADGTIYTLLDNGVPQYEINAEYVNQIVHDNHKEFLVGTTSTGDILWYDTKDTPQEIARQSFPFDSDSDVQLSTGFGWCFLVSGDICYCYQINDVNPDYTKIEIEGVAIEDVAMVDSVIILATSSGLYGLETPSFDTIWKEPTVKPHSISSSASDLVYGWTDDQFYLISPESGSQPEDSTYNRVYPTVDHTGYCIEDQDGINIYWGTGQLDYELYAEPVKLRECITPEIKIENATYKKINPKLRISHENLDVDNDNSPESTEIHRQPLIEPFSSHTIKTSPVRLTDVHATPTISIQDIDSGYEVISQEIDVGNVVTDLSVHGDVTEIDNGSVSVRITAKNTGDVPLKVTTETESNFESVEPNDDVTWVVQTKYDSANGSQHSVKYQPEHEEGSIESEATSVEHPTRPCRIKIGLEAENDTAHIKLTNTQDIPIKDRVRIITDEGTQFVGDITLGAEETGWVWVPVTTNSLTPTELCVESIHDVLDKQRSEFTEHQTLEFERTFSLPDPQTGKNDGFYPAQTPIVEHLHLENVCNRTLRDISINGVDSVSVNRLRSGESSELRRYLTLPEGDNVIPESKIHVSDDSVAVPKKELNAWQPATVNVTGTILKSGDTTALSFSINNEYPNPIQIDSVLIDNLSVSTSADSEIISSGSNVSFLCDLSDNNQVLNHSGPFVITIRYSPDNTGGVKLAQCLAHVTEPVLTNKQSVSADLSVVNLASGKGVKTTIDVGVKGPTGLMKLHVKEVNSGFTAAESFDISDFDDSENYQIILSPDRSLPRKCKFEVRVRGSTMFGEINELYEFQEKISLGSNSMKQTDSSVRSELFSTSNPQFEVDEIDITPWKLT